MKLSLLIPSLLLLSITTIAQAEQKTYVHADQIDRQTIPADTILRQGVLDNGFHYYVMHNAEEKERMYVRLLVRAGSLLEHDDELGISHFVEHMLFKGTKHFPGQQVIGFLRRHGIPFGSDSNAETHFNSVSYRLDRLTTDPETLDSTLLLLRDWAGDATIAPADVEAERNVIVEEWRLRKRDAAAEQYFDNLLCHSYYTQRLPIGDMDIIRNCTPQQVRAYYHRWYQPQNQAIVVVGDIDADQVVSKIRQLVGDRQRGDSPVPDMPLIAGCDSTRYFLGQNEDLPYCTMSVCARVPELTNQEISTVGGQRRLWLQVRIERILRKRLQALVATDNLLLETETFRQEVLDRDHDKYLRFEFSSLADYWQEAAGKLAMLIEHLRRQGFKQEELEDHYYEPEPVYNADTTAIRWDTTRHEVKPNNGNILSNLRTCFYENRIYHNQQDLGIANDYIARSATLGQLNAEFNRMTESGSLLVSGFFPTEATLPMSEELQAIFERARQMTDEELAQVDVRKPERHKYFRIDSLDISPQPGTVVQTLVLDDSTTEMLLSNGIRVIWLKGRYQDNYHEHTEANGDRVEWTFHENGPAEEWGRRIGFTFARPLGKHIFIGDDIPYRTLLPKCIKQCKTEYNSLDKYIEENREECSFGMTFFNEGNIPYIEERFKLLYAQLTCHEVDTVAFTEQVKKILVRTLSDSKPNAQAWQQMETLWSAAPDELKPISTQEALQLNLDRFQQIVRDYTSNYNGSVLCIQGNIEADLLLPIILKYVASLPSQAEPVHRIVHASDHYKNRNTVRTVKFTNPAPICHTFMYYTWQEGYRYTPCNHAHLLALMSILRQLMFDKLRAQHSDIYTSSRSITDQQTPLQHMRCDIWYSCKPENRKRIAADVRKLVEQMAKGDLITQEHIDSFVLEQEKKYANNDKITVLKDCVTRELGEIVNNDWDLAPIRQVTPASLRTFLQDMLRQGNLQIGYLTTDK